MQPRNTKCKAKTAAEHFWTKQSSVGVNCMVKSFLHQHEISLFKCHFWSLEKLGRVINRLYAQVSVIETYIQISNQITCPPSYTL